MMFLMFLIYIIQADPMVDAYQLVVKQQVYASPKECAEAGNALVEKVQQDEKVVQIIAGACLPTEQKKV